MRIAVVGGGPTGLQAIEGLLEAGVPGNQIVLFEERVLPLHKEPFNRTKRMSLADVMTASELMQRRDHGKSVGTDRISVYGPGQLKFSSSYVWGASCLPPHPDYLAAFTFPGFDSALSNVVSDWGVHGEQDPLQKIFPLHGARTGALPRKPVAYEIVGSAERNVGHSRLAVGQTSGDCYGLGACFTGCPTNAAWNPAVQLSKLARTAPEVILVRERVNSIASLKGGVEIQVGSEVLLFDKVFIAAGWQGSQALMKDLGGIWTSQTGTDFSDLEQSTVCIFPIFLRTPTDLRSTDPSFAYHDLVVVTPESEPGYGAVISQIYLPTVELAARIVARAPRSFLSCLGASMRSSLGGRAASKVLGRVAIAMTFLPGGAWNTPRVHLHRILDRAARDICEALGDEAILAMPRIAVVQDRGASHHVGAWAPAKNVARSFLESDGFDSPSVIPCDALALPRVPSGPHTLSAAAMARLMGAKMGLMVK